MEGTSILSRTIDAAHIPASGLETAIDAGAAQRDALASAYGLVAVKGLAARATLTPGRRGSIDVEGRVVADVVQSCVVTLVPVEQHIDEPFAVRFVPPDSPDAPKPSRAGAEVVVDPAAADPPEFLDDNAVDLGKLVEELFVLALDPYPRAPGAALPAEAAGPSETASESPFAVLARVRSRLG